MDKVYHGEEKPPQGEEKPPQEDTKTQEIEMKWEYFVKFCAFLWLFPFWCVFRHKLISC